MKLFTWKENRERKKMESREMVRLACEAMEDKKAQDIKIIDIEKCENKDRRKLLKVS